MRSCCLLVELHPNRVGGDSAGRLRGADCGGRGQVRRQHSQGMYVIDPSQSPHHALRATVSSLGRVR